MRKFLLAALAALSAASLSAPAEASTGVFVTYGSGYGGYNDGYRGDYYRGGRSDYYYDDYYRPRYRGYRSNRGFRDGRRFRSYRHDGHRGYRGKRFRNRY